MIDSSTEKPVHGHNTFLNQRLDHGIRIVIYGIVVNLGLAGIKILTGITGHSSALIADGIESITDVFSSAVVWQGLRIARKDTSERFHFGLGKAESLAALTVAGIVILAACSITIVAVRDIITPHQLPQPFTLAILAFVIATKELLFRKMLRDGQQMESLAVQNDAMHHRADAITSTAALIGISFALIGGPGYEAADDWAALFAAMVIFYTGLSGIRRAILDLLDQAPAEPLLADIQMAAEAVEGVRRVEKVLARRSGIGLFVDLHIHADPLISLHSAHLISGKVKSSVRKTIPAVYGVIVHMEPDETDSETT